MQSTIIINRVTDIEEICKELEKLFMRIYDYGYEYYLETGHDILESPDKQDLLMMKKSRTEIEETLVKTLIALDNLSSRSMALFRGNSVFQHHREEALHRARFQNIDKLESTGRGVRFRHLPLTELSKRGLYYHL